MSRCDILHIKIYRGTTYRTKIHRIAICYDPTGQKGNIMSNNNYFSKESIRAEQAAEAAVPVSERKTYIPGIILGICGIFGSILMPVLGLPFIVAGFILISKNSKKAKTGAAIVFCVLASIVCVLNSAAGVYLQTHPEFVQEMQEKMTESAQQAE